MYSAFARSNSPSTVSYQLGRISRARDAKAKHFYDVSLPLEKVEEIKNRLFARKARIPRRDRSALAQAIILNAGPRIRECIEGLHGAEAAKILQCALSSMIDKFCPGIGLRAHVECLAPPRQVEAGPIRTSINRDVA